MSRFTKEQRKQAKELKLPLFSITIDCMHYPERNDRRASSVTGSASPAVELAVRRAILVANEMPPGIVDAHIAKYYPHLLAGVSEIVVPEVTDAQEEVEA